MARTCSPWLPNRCVTTSLRQVARPTIPLTASSLTVWNRRIAVSVCGPNLPSAEMAKWGSGLVSSKWARAALSHRICTGLPRRKLGKLIEELAQPWLAQQESRLRDRRGRDRLRAEGAGPDRELPFADRVIITLVILRFQLPHAALAVFYGVHRSTITRAAGEIRPLLAQRGFAVPGAPGLRLRTLADVFAYAAAQGVTLRIDGTEVQVRLPRAGRPGRRAFVSGKKKQNTI